MNFLSPLIFIVFISGQAMAVSLLQKKDIVCSNTSMQVFIEKSDTYFIVDGKRFSLVEFLDNAILAKASDKEYALLQITPKSTASLIIGEMNHFIEKNCEQVKDAKDCTNDEGVELHWSPKSLKMKGEDFPVQHYGIYPHDGTGFLSYNGNRGLAIIDSGSHFLSIFGGHHRLDCRYHSFN